MSTSQRPSMARRGIAATVAVAALSPAAACGGHESKTETADGIRKAPVPSKVLETPAPLELSEAAKAVQARERLETTARLSAKRIIAAAANPLTHAESIQGGGITNKRGAAGEAHVPALFMSYDAHQRRLHFITSQTFKNKQFGLVTLDFTTSEKTFATYALAQGRELTTNDYDRLLDDNKLALQEVTVHGSSTNMSLTETAHGSEYIYSRGELFRDDPNPDVLRIRSLDNFLGRAVSAIEGEY